MDFSNERYVRLYTRDTTGWKLLRWQGQTVWTLLYRKADRAGVVSLDGLEPWEAVVLHCDLPEEVAQPGMQRCLDRGWIVRDGDRLVFPKFIEANETPMSDAQRARESRAKRATLSPEVTTKAFVTKRDDMASRIVTAPSPDVTGCHAESHAVTPRHSTPSTPSTPSVLSFTEPERETRAREAPSDFPEESIETDRRRGNDFMLEATARPWQGYDHELALIGSKPRAELLRALEAIRGDPWCQANMPKVSPKHVLRKWNDYSTGSTKMQLAKAETSESSKWRSRVQQSTKKLEELHESRRQLQPGPNYASQLYDLDKAIREESEALERRKRELHALTG